MGTSAPKLGSRVRALRSRKGLTQKAMAERLGISASYLNLIEHNRRPLSVEVLLKLATVFDVDVRGFATEDDERLAEDLVEAFTTSGIRGSTRSASKTTTSATIPSRSSPRSWKPQFVAVS